jgi:hypothetical protein
MSDIETLVLIDKRIDESEADALRDRWEFGKLMLAERVGKQLPKGMQAQLVQATGKSEREIRYRMQFAEKYPSEAEVGKALPTFESWSQVIKSMATPRPKREPKPTPQLEARQEELDLRMDTPLDATKSSVRKAVRIAATASIDRIDPAQQPHVKRLSVALRDMAMADDPNKAYIAACLALADLVSVMSEGK